MSAAGGNRSRKKSKSRTRRIHSRERMNAGEGPSNSRRHPSHLRGKEIGLFYARRNKENGGIQRRPIGTIFLSDFEKKDIERVLLSTGGNEFQSGDKYENVQDSLFKREFLSSINGDIFKKLLKCSPIIHPNPVADEILFEEYKRKMDNPKYQEMIKHRQRLPSYKMKDELLKMINDNQVVVISGETGCGKTTQVAQFILENYTERKMGSVCNIICSQPRRISAISVAERVAEERAEKLGNSVGFKIRLERKLPRERGSICFCTTGVILKQMENDPSLRNISHLILDEIHERDVNSDFLIAIVKHVIKVRTDLKLILMSATLNAESFSKYYDNAPHINIPGFTYPVQEYFLEDVLQVTKYQFEETPQRDERHGRRKWGKQHAMSEFSEFIEPHVRLLEAERKYDREVIKQLRNPASEELNIELILELLIYICRTAKDNGSILVFLPGFAEINSLNSHMDDSGKFPRNQYIIIPLHSQMPTVDQKEIFNPAPPGKRKIIISTNIAETSITIDDVVYVIDCGRIKISNFDVENNIQTLSTQWVALANASQRKGRAGRVKSGICYHLYSKAREMTLDQYQLPEILRKRLEDVILVAKMLQLGPIKPFFSTLLSTPDPKAIDLSLNLLNRLNALDDEENLTPLGYHLAKLPIQPQLGKMILFGAIFSCLDPILSVAASLDFKDPFQQPLGMDKKVREKKRQLAQDVYSDHLLVHQAMVEFQRVGNQRQFCYEYFLSYATMKMLSDMKRQFMEYLMDMNFVDNLNHRDPNLNVNSGNISLIKAIICAGLYPNIGIVKKTFKGVCKIVSLDQEKLKFHPKSLYSGDIYLDGNMIVYYLKLKSSSIFVHDVTAIYSLPVIFFGDQYKHTKEDGHNSILVANKLKFKCTESTAKLIKELRNRLNYLLEYKITHPGIVNWQKTESSDIKLLGAIMKLITKEDTGDMDLDAYDDFD